MPHYVSLDPQGFAKKVELASEPPTGCQSVELETAPPATILWPNKHRYIGGKFVDTGEPWITPTYATRRAVAYPSIAEQLDMLWHAMSEGTMPKAEPFYSSIKAVKDAIPKP